MQYTAGPMELTFFDAETLERRLTYPLLVDRLEAAFRAGCDMPVRHQHEVQGGDGTLLLMPAWRQEGGLGVKVVNVFGGNGARGLPAVHGLYLLFDGATGVPRAVLDGDALTVRRTAAASALAARFLAREDSRILLMVGAGSLAPHLIEAHRAVRPIERVLCWNRGAERRDALLRRLEEAGVPAEPVEDLDAAVAEADVISCATLATEPLVRGACLPAGVHLDLVGAFTPTMREVDDEAVRRCRLFADQRAATLAEAGDLVSPLRRGVITEEALEADLFELCRGTATGRRSQDERTLFKSVGLALEDLAAAELVVG